MGDLNSLNMFVGLTPNIVEFCEFEQYGNGHTAKYRVWRGSDVTNLMYLGKSKFLNETTVEYECVDCHSKFRVKLSKHIDPSLYIECECGEKSEPTIKG